ncbi:hypothetical protein [Micromonospora foliorum]|uniref:hypothetical protein n=1 Tax=Micromonospora foliorum TaxID=2911210 RepID=UPI001EE942FC|nr:hypothetical protein [Micromonospora foliorum]MCG5435159.1 hypothetical protein [Micromonospora foliorum]
MRRRIIFAGIGMAAAALTAASITASVLTADSVSGASAARQGIILGDAVDNLPSQTASDWVTYADHVVVVTATSETVTPPTPTEIARGEGLIGRQVSLRIDDVLWSRAGAPKPAPHVWEYSAFGWQFTEGDTSHRTRMALRDRPRVEVGHRYVMAMVWEEARCSAGDEPEPAQWRGLGEGSEIPYDNNTIGQGELEGRAQTAVEARQMAAEAGPNLGLKHELAGSGAALLASKLKAAAPLVNKKFSPQSATNCN